MSSPVTLFLHCDCSMLQPLVATDAAGDTDGTIRCKDTYPFTKLPQSKQKTITIDNSIIATE